MSADQLKFPWCFDTLGMKDRITSPAIHTLVRAEEIIEIPDTGRYMHKRELGVIAVPARRKFASMDASHLVLLSMGWFMLYSIDSRLRNRVTGPECLGHGSKPPAKTHLHDNPSPIKAAVMSRPL